ncbi:MAG: hypothetical protein LM571_01110 [Desulfurococcaceae archaeon]|nr:hypothetical protein [Desulfurococcaceae archaeon]
MDPLLTALLILSALLILTTLLPWILAFTRKPGPAREELVSVLRCSKCGYEEIRKYNKGDYVGRPVGSCPRDGSRMVIKAIYVETLPQG